MSVALRDIPQAFHYPRPDWASIREWVEGNIAPDERPAAWTAIACDWLRVLAGVLGDDYRIDRSQRLMLLSPMSEADATSLLKFAEYGLSGIVDSLGELACEAWLGPLVILLFADDTAYLRYISSWDSDEPPVPSGGMCLRGGYVHLALPRSPMEQLQQTVLHELTHGCLSHLRLPLWIEEGITQLAEEGARPHWGRFSLSAEEAAVIRGYWRREGLGRFWWGPGFSRHDEGQTCSYRLADILFRIISADHRRQLADFVRHAHEDDAGESAARTHLGCGLADLARQFLGDGDWEPRPLDAGGYVRRGALAASDGDHESAIRDFDCAIERDGGMAAAYLERGWSEYERGRTVEAIADCERAIDLDPDEYFAHNNLAWILATSPDDRVRDGERALRHALIACERSGYAVWNCVGTLAAAYAEVGDCEEAVRWAMESIELAPAEERDGCEQRLRVFEDGGNIRKSARV